MPFDPSKHHRRSIRLKGYDYTSPGAYAITICTHQRLPHLTNPIYHHIVQTAWNLLPHHFPTVLLDTIGIIPDHVHILIWLQPTPTQKTLLGDIVARFKSDISRAISLRISLNGGTPIPSLWQNKFYDHIIRNKRDLETQRRYILENPEKHRLKDEGHL
jgi:putative transposase